MNKVEIFYEEEKNLSTFMAVLKTICTPGSAIWPNSLESGNRFDYSFSSQLMLPELGGMSCLLYIRLLSRRI